MSKMGTKGRLVMILRYPISLKGVIALLVHVYYQPNFKQRQVDGSRLTSQYRIPLKGLDWKTSPVIACAVLDL